MRILLLQQYCPVFILATNSYTNIDMHFARLILIFCFILFLSGCSPIAAVGMLVSTIVKTVANAQENQNPTPVRRSEPDQYDRQAIAEANLTLAIAYMREREYK